MPSIRYKLTALLFKHMVRPMMKKAAAEPERFLDEQCKTRQKKKLPLAVFHKKYDFDEKTAGDVPYYVIHSRAKTGKKAVFYFFGGGFVMPGDEGDFSFAQEMADKTGADVWLPWQRLLPDATGQELLESVLSVYRQALKEYAAKDIAFFGLSSGGSLCLDLCVYIREQRPELPLPAKLVPFSATIQMPPSAEQRAQMQKLGEQDAMFPPEYVDTAEKMMTLCGAAGFLGNSVAHSWKGFPRMLALYGSKEIYYAELDAFKKKCEEDGVELKVHIGDGMMHTWAAAGWLPEAKAAREMIYAYIRE